jgi:hypothetical protein
MQYCQRPRQTRSTTSRSTNRRHARRTSLANLLIVDHRTIDQDFQCENVRRTEYWAVIDLPNHGRGDEQFRVTALRSASSAVPSARHSNTKPRSNKGPPSLNSTNPLHEWITG